MKFKQIVQSIFFAALLGVAGTSSASTVYDGTVSGADGSWGFVNFGHGGGALSIDSWAHNFTGGPTGFGIDDIYLSLFVNNGSSTSAFTGAFVGANDDFWSPSDGSTSGLDSFLSFANLSAGSYTLAISHCCTNFDYVRNDSVSSGIHGVLRDYRLTFSQDVAIEGVVPEPQSLLLMLTALAALGLAIRRKA